MGVCGVQYVLCTFNNLLSGNVHFNLQLLYVMLALTKGKESKRKIRGRRGTSFNPSFFIHFFQRSRSEGQTQLQVSQNKNMRRADGEVTWSNNRFHDSVWYTSVFLLSDRLQTDHDNDDGFHRSVKSQNTWSSDSAAPVVLSPRPAAVYVSGAEPLDPHGVMKGLTARFNTALN